MNREDKIKILLDRGYKYDENTGDIIGARGNKIIGKSCGYIQIKFYYNGKYYSVLGHQFAWYYRHKEIVKFLDHINGIKTDNRIINLRSVNTQQNAWNRKSVKGYSYHKKNRKWVAQISIKGINTNIGYYETEEEARQAYLDAKKIYHII